MSGHPLTNRLKKRFKHLKKWAKRENVTCFRVYNRDMTEFPLIVDWIDGEVVVWMYDPLKYSDIEGPICDAFEIDSLRLFVKHRGKQKGLSTQYKKTGKDAITKVILENELKFELNLSDYLDTGLFLDHRNTRKMCQSLSQGKRVLNLFAYTGSFTCYAKQGGALSTTTVDLSSNYIDWAKRNFALNGFEESPSHRFIVADCLTFIKNEAKQNRYDVIICDPPTFSNSKKMTSTFSVDDSYAELINDCMKLLSEDGVLLFSTNSRKFKLDETQIVGGLVKEITTQTIPEDFKGSGIHKCWQITAAT